MPELPEVETMRRCLQKYQHHLIKNIEIRTSKLRKPISDNLSHIVGGQTLQEIHRIGKYLFFMLSNQCCLLMHAGMSGTFNIYHHPENVKKHDHLVFFLQHPQTNNTTIVSYNDPRKFGLALCFSDIQQAQQYANLGVDALSEEFNLSFLTKAVKMKKCDIKTFLLNQQIVAGIGNIYASEILYYSKIHPKSMVKNIPTNKLAEVIEHTKKVLLRSIELGGSTLKDYKQPTGKLGYFQTTFAVYGKEKQFCPNCATPIEKITQAGRSTFFCPQEQIIY